MSHLLKRVCPIYELVVINLLRQYVSHLLCIMEIRCV